MRPRRPNNGGLALATVLAARLGTPGSVANPAGLSVATGSASTTTQGARLQVTASADAVLRWQSFDIAPNERTVFVQPSAASVVWNQIDGANPSAIFGRLDANGVVVLVNPTGFHFGPDAVVGAAGLVVSTAPAAPSVAGGPTPWKFADPLPGSSIRNLGRLRVDDGGMLFLIADRIENCGSLEAPGGNLGLQCAREVVLSNRPDGRGLSVSVQLPAGAIDNSGRIVADAGTIRLGAKVVNQGGLVQADAIQERGGVVELVASETLTLGGASMTHVEGAPGATMRLEAGTDVTAANGARVVAAGNATLAVRAALPNGAGANPANPDPTGSIVLEGDATFESARGSIAVAAGDSVSVAAGAIRTTDGGDIAVTARKGNIDAGTRDRGFQFFPGGYVVDPELGGISTAAGGDVTLVAGRDVRGFLPLPGEIQTDAGSGAFGARPGQVTITAGRDVAGHFVVANGEGRIDAGHDAGTVSRPLALSLVSGGWTVEAGGDLRLQEIRNPNGVFNHTGFAASPNRQRFDYAEDAFAVLRAGHAVALGGALLPRYLDAFSLGMPPIYPGSLTIDAGSGGVTLGNDLVLFPSATGNLRVTTTDGGGLVGTRPGDLVQLVLSDSGRTRYHSAGDFGLADHALTPRHLDDPEPLRLDLAGSMTGVLLGSAKRADLRIGGSIVNSRFEGQNLHAGDVTRIVVAGDILNRGELSSVAVSGTPRFDVFDLVYPPLPFQIAALANRFVYEADRGQLTFQGRMSGDELQALLQLRVRAFDAAGIPLVDSAGEPITVAARFTDDATLRRLFDASQDVPSNVDTGYRLGGGGRFEIRARNLDLGTTTGIVTQGPRANPALARLFDRGADLGVTLEGNLDLFSSRIATVAGGAIDVTADGAIRVGSREFQATDVMARGIFATGSGDDVTVTARGDVEVAGSRIAAYDGGRLAVVSLEGNVDIGAGALGTASVEKIVVDPVTREVRSFTPTIPGTGLLATSFPESFDSSFPASLAVPGNLVVEAPHGDILASAGGIVQIPLNGNRTPGGGVRLEAGSRDAAGTVTHAGNIDVSGSGVIGGTVRLEATGDVRGVLFARENLEVSVGRRVDIEALATGNARITAGDRVSGTIIGIAGLAASAADIDAALLSQDPATQGKLGSSQVGFEHGTSADAASASPSAATSGSGDRLTSRGRPVTSTGAPRTNAATALAPRSVSRVTVLPPEP